MDITLTVRSVHIDSTARDRDIDVAMDTVDITQVVKECGESELLDEIGKAAVEDWIEGQ